MSGQRNSELTELPEPMQHWKYPILKKWPPRGHESYCSVVYILFNPWTHLLGTRGCVPARTRGESRILHRKQITKVQPFDVRRRYVLRDYLRPRRAGTYSSLTADARTSFLFHRCFIYSDKRLVYILYWSLLDTFASTIHSIYASVAALA